jgi:Protein of unknown function (DUF3891)
MPRRGLGRTRYAVRAVRLIAAEDAYAAVLISMHTYSLLSEHADRSTIAPEQLPLLDEFLNQKGDLQRLLVQEIVANTRLSPEQTSESAIRDHFRLLQATDNLSLLTCVDFRAPAHLLHPLPLRDGSYSRIAVTAVSSRHCVLDPYPFDEPSISFQFLARHVQGKLFPSAAELQERFHGAPTATLSVTVSGG